ncbi:MAG: hypothetical protein QOD81_1 [Solirubrobacteraceae bacterium]|nr:hypothetical protein [Solirubrobacteraceae bacterium]
MSPSPSLRPAKRMATSAANALWRRHWHLLVVAAVLAVALVPSASGALAPQPGQRIDMKVLLLSATGTEATFGAWKAELTREGVPFDAKIADAEAPFTDATFADYAGNHALYQAVILATGDLVHQVTNADATVSFPSALDDSEWTALAKFEQTFGIRQVSDSTFPSAVHGLNGPSVPGAAQDGNTGQLSAGGLAVFPYLKGPVPIGDPAPAATAFGYQATPAAQVAPAAFETLLGGPNSSSYLGIYTHADGREEMVMTVDSNENQIHAMLLRHGVLSWVTRNVFLGYQRNYFDMQVDDVFLPDARWDTTLNRSLVDGPTAAPDETECAPAGGPNGFVAGGGVSPAAPGTGTGAATLPPCRPIRMTAADVTRLVTWQNTSGIKLDMVFNGSGSADFIADTASPTDPLTDAYLANKAAFRWINHTFTHLNLDLATQAQLTSEIGDNIAWGVSHGLPMNPAELVTGEHSGLHNPLMAGTFDALGIKWTAADNSREPTQYAIGGAMTVPRYPANIYYNVETQAEQLDEYNYIYLPPPAGKCVNSATNTCRTAPATWAQYMDSEVGIMFRHLMLNDSRPHFAHQSNLAADGILYTILDELLRRYRLYFSPGLVQLTHTEIGQQIQRQAKWAQDLAAGRATAWLQDGQVHVTTTDTIDVPITGTPEGALYGGERSGWFTVSPGQPLTATAPPAAQAIARPGTAATPAPPAAAPAPAPASGTAGTQRRSPAPNAGRAALTMRRLKMSPRRFVVSRSRSAARGRRGRGPTGSTITWLMNEKASVTLAVQRISRGRHVAVMTLKRTGIRGENTVRFSGRVGRRTLRPGRYRVRITARTPDGRHVGPRTLTFTVVRG